MRAVFLDLETLDDLDLTPLERVVDELVCYPHTTPEQVAERIAGFDVVVTNKTGLTAEHMAAAEGLQLICVAATGVNNLDLAMARSLGITVCNAQGYGTRSVAQHVITLIMALHTRLLDYDRAVRNGDWNRTDQFCLLDYPIIEVSGRTLGIIGYGTLGQAVAQQAQALGMKVLVAARPGEPASEGRLPFAQLLEQVDVLSLHCPLTEQTRNLIDAAALARMKPGSFIVNAARGGIVNEEALAAALRSGHLGGAATDVLSVEPPREGNPLLDPSLPNLIVTPHCAWGSREARETIIRQLAENIQAFRDGAPRRCVNL